MNRWLTGTWPRAAVAAVSLAAPMLAAALPACASTLPGPPARALGAAAHGAGPALARPGHAAAHSRPAVPPAVVIAGIAGLRWTDVSPQATPQLWRIAAGGSVGTLVVRTVLPRTCPVDGWLTLNAGARAMARHTEKGVCPAVAAPAALPQIAHYNKRFHYNPHWGLLASAAGPGRCATAIGPGAALALARPAGQRSLAPRYVPDAVGVSRSELARCPLTVVDLGAVPAARGRAAAVRADDRRLGQIAAAIPRGGLLVVAAPADAATPHLRVVVVSGPGYLAGLLRTASTRQPGLVQLTDLTAAVLTWRHQRLPGDLVGSALQRQARGGRLAAAVGGLVGQDTAAQVHRSTAGWFFAAYAVGDGVLFGAITLFCWGAARRKRRHRWLRIAGAFTGAVVPASFLASLVPWWRLAHPAGTLYVLTAASAAVIGAAALAGPWRRDPFGPVGVVSVITVAVIGLDVMTGSRLQIGTPFGLSTLEAGRFYGVGNNALGPYGAAGILAGAWLALVAAARAAPAREGDPLGGRDRPQRPAALARGDGPRPPGDDPPARGGDPPAPPARAGAARRDATLAVAGVAAFAVIASGWPGFGSKFGGTVAMVPGFVLLGLHAAGVRVTLRRAALIAVSGLAAVVVFALVNYFVPLTGQSHIGEFVGQVLHGGAGGVLQRKINSNVGSLTITPYSPLVPVVVIALGLLLARPRWFGAWWLPRSWAAAPMLRATMAALWVVAVLGWLADDSGVTVAAAALPFALPLAIAIHAGVGGPPGDRREQTAQNTPHAPHQITRST